MLISCVKLDHALHSINYGNSDLHFRSVPGKHPWGLKHNLHGRFTWDINCIHLYRSCYIHPSIEMRYKGTYPGVGACPGHYDINQHLQYSVYTVQSTQSYSIDLRIVLYVKILSDISDDDLYNCLLFDM